MKEETEKIKLIVDLTLAKVSILELKADDYKWQVFVDKDTQEKLLKTVSDIDFILKSLK